MLSSLASLWARGRQNLRPAGGTQFIRWTLPSSPWTAGFYRSLNTAHRSWTSHEDDRFRKLYNDGLPLAQMAILLGRSMSAIQMKRRRLQSDGLLEPLSAHRFSAEENAILAEGRENGLSYKQLASRLPGRTVSGIRARRAAQMREGHVSHTVPLTLSEVQALVELRDKQQLGWTAIARLMSGRDPAVLRHFYSRRICPHSKTIKPLEGRVPPAVVEKMKFLRTEGWKLSEIAHETDRSISCVSTLLRAAGKRTFLLETRPRWSQDDIDKLLTLKAEGLPIGDICRKLNRSLGAVYKKWHGLRAVRGKSSSQI